MYERALPTITHLKEVIAFTQRFSVHNKIYINPLSSFREDFFVGGILFQCISDKKSKDVFAAGGRYDSLITEHRPRLGSQAHQRHAVGFSLAWEKLARIPKPTGKQFLKKNEADHQGIFNTRRVSIAIHPLTN
jgi:eukaryotic translation initiation factor 2-alpha kinase 4